MLGVGPYLKDVPLGDACMGGSWHAAFLVDLWLARIALSPAGRVDHGVFVSIVVRRTGKALHDDFMDCRCDMGSMTCVRRVL